MGSLEILRQGVWASLTGGWFYDPHQSVFCNAVHLYIWLFLLCMPFISYLYFPTTLTTWGVYCITVACTITVLKIINIGLHSVFDKAQALSESNAKKPLKECRKPSWDEEGGIEMQVLGPENGSRMSVERHSDDISCANSAISIEYQGQPASTIDYKVDVHRKNSSESSDSAVAGVDLPQIDESQSPVSGDDGAKDTFSVVAPHESTAICVEEAEHEISVSIPDETVSKFDSESMNVRSEIVELSRNEKEKKIHGKLQRQASLDSDNVTLHETTRKKLPSTVFRGSDSADGGMVSVMGGHSTHHHHHHRHHRNQSNVSLGEVSRQPENSGSTYHKSAIHSHGLTSEMYLENNYSTKSELAIEQIPETSGTKMYMPATPMRKDSNSTMSAIQLPTASTASSSSRLRRHSNNASVNSSMRRIKSSLLETCCPPPSVSNLSAHPNSAEAIGGANTTTLRNPQYAVLPPPSKTLSRKPHLNLYPKGGASGGASSSLTTDPIAEQAIEELYVWAITPFHIKMAMINTEEDGVAGARSNNQNGGADDDDEEDEDHDRDEEDDDDDDEEEGEEGSHNVVRSHRLSTTTESESDLDRQQTQSTDSDTENNGSRSPLLDVRSRLAFMQTDSKQSESDKSKTLKHEEQTLIEKMKKIDRKEMLAEGSKSSETVCPSMAGGDWELEAGSNNAISNVILATRSASGGIRKRDDSTKEGDSIAESSVLDPQASCASKSFSSQKEMTDGVEMSLTQRSLGAIPKSTTRPMTYRCMSAGTEDCLFRSRSRGGLIHRNISIPAGPMMFTILSRSEQPIPLYPTGRSNFFEHSIPDAGFRPRAYAIADSSSYRAHFHPSASKMRRSTRSRRRTSFETAQHSSRDEETGADIGSEFGSGTIGEIQEHSLDASASVYPSFVDDTYGAAFDKAFSARSTHSAAILNMGRAEMADSAFTDFGRPYMTAMEKFIISETRRHCRIPINMFGKKEFVISMDRLRLLALFDRDSGWCQVLLAIVLATLVAVLGALVLQMGLYKDLFAFVFCFVIAGSQYSLLKSVQPDAASPVHGFNKTVAYSRAIYFCLCAGIMLLARSLSDPATASTEALHIFGIKFVQRDCCTLIEYFISIVLLLFPVLFSLGLFPQVNTFLMYLLEQIDMHVFGGNAVCSLLSGFISVFKSIIAGLILYGPALGGLSEPRGSQHFLFSIFCGLLILIAYHLSRSASDFSCLWALIKKSLVINSDEDDEEEKTDEKQKEKDTMPSTEDELNQKTPQVADSKEKLNEKEVITETELIDPLPKKLQKTVNARLKNDLLVGTVLGVVIFGLHCSTVFTVLQPDLNPVLHSIAVILGLFLHYIIPQLRKNLPWLCIARPVLRAHEHGQFEVKESSKVTWFENMYVCFCFLERNVIYPLVFLSALTADSMSIVQKYGVPFGVVIVVVCGMKCVRSSYSDPASQYIILVFTVLLFRFDFNSASETFLVDYFVVAIVFKKICDFLLKLQFIVTYIAPWQITWGSAFHAFAQPFSVPHSAMLFLQAAISALLSTPLNPFLGSAIFLTSYVRPIKFWERDYNTRRIDHSNTRLSSQLERDLGADDNNLNSIFYEHLTRSLQHSLCGDLLLGRWGNVSQGDCFVLASDYLNCLVHIIELGNGLCTFQMRGLEFRGTYCQQREVEAISEGIEENDGCCCCSPGHLPQMLSANAMFSTRWLAWQVIAAQYVLEGYSISDNSAIATLQVFEFRRVLITYYVKSIIYYTIRSPKLNEWLTSRDIKEKLNPTLDKQFVDLDPIFNHNLDEDFDFRASGVTRASFCNVYMDWIQYCYSQRQQQQQQQESGSQSGPPPPPPPADGPQLNAKTPSPANSKPVREGGASASQTKPNLRVFTADTNLSEDNPPIQHNLITLVSLCLALGLLARRTLATASQSSLTSVEFFLHGLHSLFKGDFRITSPRDEWVFADMELLHGVLAPAVRMSLKLHQDHFLNPDEYEDLPALYEAINFHSQDLVISHEADPLWRSAVLRGTPNLLALRHVLEDGADEYRVIRLTKRYLSFRVIKLNRECVRGLWAGQQQELIYLRNRNPERGSIQNAKQALRNIINSSCDQPIGYPIYVSPLTTSYAETNEQVCRIVGGAFSLDKIRSVALDFWRHVRQRCREGCSSGSRMEGELAEIPGVYYSAPTPNNTLSGTTATLSYGSQNLSLAGTANRGSLASMGKPTSSTLLAGFLNRERDLDRESIRDRCTAKRSSAAGPARTGDRERRATLPATSAMHPPAFEAIEATDLERELMASGVSYYRSGGQIGITAPPSVILNRKVIIVDIFQIYENLDRSRPIDMLWPSEHMRLAGGRSSWRDWTPQEGMVGFVIHYWQPNHPHFRHQTNINRTVLLVQIGDRFVPIGERGVREYNTVTPTPTPTADAGVSGRSLEEGVAEEEEEDEDEEEEEEDDEEEEENDEAKNKQKSHDHHNEEAAAVAVAATEAVSAVEVEVAEVEDNEETNDNNNNNNNSNNNHNDNDDNNNGESGEMSLIVGNAVQSPLKKESTDVKKNDSGDSEGNGHGDGDGDGDGFGIGNDEADTTLQICAETENGDTVDDNKQDDDADVSECRNKES